MHIHNVNIIKQIIKMKSFNTYSTINIFIQETSGKLVFIEISLHNITLCNLVQTLKI